MKPREEPKKRMTIYVSPALRTWLRHRSAATDRSVSEIAEDLMTSRIKLDIPLDHDCLQVG